MWHRNQDKWEMKLVRVAHTPVLRGGHLIFPLSFCPLFSQEFSAFPPWILIPEL
jgi:hypothetical protein